MRKSQGSKERIGFIGLGTIGKPMARRLVEKGLDVIVYDVRKEPVEELERLGAKVARSIKEIGTLSDIIIIMVRTTAQADAVILGEDGVLSEAKEGALIVVMSTVDPVFCQKVTKLAAKKNVGFLDAPVSGGSIGVEAGTLTMMVGGEEVLIKKCQYVLEIWGKKIFHVGDVGMGQVMKLVNNLIMNVNFVTLFEGISLATKAGIELERFLEIIQVSSGSSWAAQNWNFWRKLKQEQVNGIEVTYKDLRLALDTSKSYGVHLPLLEFVTQLDLSEMIK